MKIFHLPDLGEGLAEAEIREWYVKVGEHVTVDQPVVSMETAKAVVDVPSPYTGQITELHGKVNDIVKTGAPLISIKTAETIQSNPPPHVENLAASHGVFDVNKDKGSVVGKLETSENKWDDVEAVIGSVNVKSSSLKAMPTARLLANQMQVDLSRVIPTGPDGLITTNDVKQFLNSSSSLPAPVSAHTETLHGVRRAMAKVMLKSHQEVVPVTIMEEADITDLPPHTDLTLCLLKAIAAAVKVEPALNAWFDSQTLDRKLFSEVHVGLAMDTAEGLFVPVLKKVETTSHVALRQAIDHYKKIIKNRSISSSDLQGATITLSNFGTIAGCYATPIIVPPTVAILGSGRAREAVLARQGEIQVGRILPLSLTIDHRAVTGGEASRFLGEVLAYLRMITVSE